MGKQLRCAICRDEMEPVADGVKYFDSPNDRRGRPIVLIHVCNRCMQKIDREQKRVVGRGLY